MGVVLYYSHLFKNEETKSTEQARLENFLIEVDRHVFCSNPQEVEHFIGVVRAYIETERDDAYNSGVVQGFYGGRFTQCEQATFI